MKQANVKEKYSINETMCLIGKQRIFDIPLTDMFKELDEIISANNAIKSNVQELCIDVFMIGYIEGKKAERKKNQM